MSGAVILEFVQEDLDPEGNADVALWDDTRRRRGADDALVFATGTSRTITLATDDATKGLDIDFENLAVLGAGKVLEGKAAGGTVAQVLWKVFDLLNGRQSGVVSARVTGLAFSVAARTGRSGSRVGGGHGGGLGDGRRRFGLSAVELPFEVENARLEGGDFVLEIGLAGLGALVHALPIARIATGGEQVGKRRRITRSGGKDNQRSRRVARSLWARRPNRSIARRCRPSGRQCLGADLLRNFLLNLL